MMTVRSKLIDSYLKEGFEPFYSEESRKKFVKECLTKIEQFGKVLINKGHEVKFEHLSKDNVEQFALAIDGLSTVYIFTLTNKHFEYEIYRRDS
ncbi:hypothetical protein SFPB_046 [Shigella phage SFPB]|uniref:Uncharacterized protein n=3 Tax=Mooglevirus TaxID=1985303 RepID=A0AAE9VV11_9CAUD|nr:hypothetical protein SFPB_046 [Shigella phage SFPB]